MSKEIFQSKEYKEIMQKCLVDTIALLFNENKYFSILCRVENIEFTPMLPNDIYQQFGSEIIFSLSGYTYESASINKDYLTFEAGFGSESIGSVLQIPILNILHLIIDNNTPLVINHAPLIEEDKSPKEIIKNNSMEALMNNPENQKLASFRKAQKK